MREKAKNAVNLYIFTFEICEKNFYFPSCRTESLAKSGENAKNEHRIPSSPAVHNLRLDGRMGSSIMKFAAVHM